MLNCKDALSSMEMVVDLNNGREYVITPYIYNFTNAYDVVNMYLHEYVNHLSIDEIEELTLNEILYRAGAMNGSKIKNFTSEVDNLNIEHNVFNEFIDAFTIAARLCWSNVTIPDKHYVAGVIPVKGCNMVIKMAHWRKKR